jgi:uncharacterized protein (DUF2062 family)
VGLIVVSIGAAALTNPVMMPSDGGVWVSCVCSGALILDHRLRMMIGKNTSCSLISVML